MVLKAFKVNDNKVVEFSSRANQTIVNSFKNNKFKNLTYITNLKDMEEPIFLTSNAKKTFKHLKQAFVKALIFWPFNLKSYIQIEINILDYIIDAALN